jgi:hypothetical protein
MYIVPVPRDWSHRMLRHSKLLLFFVCVALSACGPKELTRSKAAELIKAKYFSPEALKAARKTIPIYVGQNIVAGVNGPARPGIDLGMPQFRGLESAGFVTLNVRDCRFGSCTLDVALTQKGKTASSGWIPDDVQLGNNRWKLPVASAEFIEITGIVSQSPTTAIADYTAKWNPTSDGSAIGIPNSPIMSGKVSFQKYDDGWRIVE